MTNTLLAHSIRSGLWRSATAGAIQAEGGALATLCAGLASLRAEVSALGERLAHLADLTSGGGWAADLHEQRGGALLATAGAPGRPQHLADRLAVEPGGADWQHLWQPWQSRQAMFSSSAGAGTAPKRGNRSSSRAAAAGPLAEGNQHRAAHQQRLVKSRQLAEQMAGGLAAPLAGLASVLDMAVDAQQVQAVRAAFVASSQRIGWSSRRQGAWLDEEGGRDLATWLQFECGLVDAGEVLGLLLKYPQLLQQTRAEQLRRTVALLQRHLQAGSSDMRRLLLARMDVALLDPEELQGTLKLLAAMPWKPGQLLALVAGPAAGQKGAGRRRRSKQAADAPGAAAEAGASGGVSCSQLLFVAASALGTRFAYLVGLGLRPQQIADMLQAAPGWALRPLRHLATSWQFAQQELRAAPSDLVACPQLLTRDLCRVLGPRTAFAKKKRIKVLLPSETLGLDILRHQDQWREHHMVPLAKWLGMPDADLCAALHLDEAEFKRYRQAWEMTTGQRWRAAMEGQQQNAAPATGAGKGTGRGRGSVPQPAASQALEDAPPSDESELLLNRVH